MAEAVPSDEVRVLVYESSNVQRRILEAMLKLAGYVYHSVFTADDALREARSGAYGIFISNIEHSDLSGLELFWHLKADDNALGIYCIAVTAGERIQTVAEALDSGADDFIRKPYEELELNARVRAASRTVLLQQKLTRLALTDALTGVANRRAFMERLGAEVSRAHRHGNTLSVIMADIDHFKRVNDTYGHAAGDVVICDTVTRMGTGTRQSDLLGRLGGEEFAVLLPETDAKAAMALAEKMRKAVDAETFQVADGCALPVSISLGVAQWTDDDKSAEDLLSRADHALYLSKEAGRNRVSCAETARVPVAEHAS
ncbi:MAG: diguanylate cyclase response regulator [Rhodobiaceae bacterium]|nr:MAG: diguanylate cyclase response regulator [Rhodobiaceae bacterium]